jgi:UDP-glucose:(heptosyl)LPS alpha-1,3-glucosyltransferase
MVVLEAMAHALPVIVSDAAYCGFAEHLSNNEALLIHNPTDTAEIAQYINKLFTDTELRQSLASKGRDKALSITWEETLAQTQSAFNKALAKKS